MRKNAWQKRLTTLVALWLCCTVFGMTQAAAGTTHSGADTLEVSEQYPAAIDAPDEATTAPAAEAQATATPAAQQLPTVALLLPRLQRTLPTRLPERLCYQQFHASPCDRRTAQHNQLLMVC